MVPEDYVHRIGRTGRAGETGQAISLVCVDETPLLRSIQQLLKRTIPSEVIAGFEPDLRVRPEPIRLRSTPAERREQSAARATVQGGRGSAAGVARGGGDGRGHRAPDRRTDGGGVAMPRRAVDHSMEPRRQGGAPADPRRSGVGHPVAGSPAQGNANRRRRRPGGNRGNGPVGSGFGNGPTQRREGPSHGPSSQHRSGSHGRGPGQGSQSSSHAGSRQAMPGERIRRFE